MFTIVRGVFRDKGADVRRKVFGIYGFLIGFNVAAWVYTLAAFHNHPVLLGTALLAYGFGLRHAVDADHIAAIDNVTRKLMQEGKRPLGVGSVCSWGIQPWLSWRRRPRGNRDGIGDGGAVRGAELCSALSSRPASPAVPASRSRRSNCSSSAPSGAPSVMCATAASYVDEDFDLLLNKRGVWRGCSGRCSA